MTFEERWIELLGDVKAAFLYHIEEKTPASSSKLDSQIGRFNLFVRSNQGILASRSEAVVLIERWNEFVTSVSEGGDLTSTMEHLLDAIDHAMRAVQPRKEKTIRIFLASSDELREDRDAFDLYFRQQNDRLRQEGLYLEIVRWENSLDAMSETRLQNEYNTLVRQADVFVALFRTKTGEFTEEEFSVAHDAFLRTGKPLIYTFFSNAPVSLGKVMSPDLMTLLRFKERLDKLGHFYTDYDSIEHLKRQFRDQLDKLRAAAKL